MNRREFPLCASVVLKTFNTATLDLTGTRRQEWVIAFARISGAKKRLADIARATDGNFLFQTTRRPSKNAGTTFVTSLRREEVSI